MRIRSGVPLVHAGMAAAACVVLGLCGSFLYLMAAEGRASLFLYLFLTPFLLAGVVLGYVGVRGLLRLVRHGRWALEVPGDGGVFGRPLQVTLHAGREVTATAELKCSLRCVSLVFGTGKGARSSQTVLWHTAWTLPAATILPQVGLPLTLPLPDSGRASQKSRQGNTATCWQLNVVFDSAGMSEEPVFDIPVRNA